MKNILIKSKLVVLCISLITLYRCVGPDKGSFTDFPNNTKGKVFVIWALSDIQPRHFDQRWHFETTIKDVNQNIRNINLALVAGDIIQSRNSPDLFKWYVETRDKSYIKYWYEIAGNHDQKDYVNYRKYIKMPLHYSVRAGNILILCLSDENSKPPTVISDNAFNWWKKMVINNQDKIIITVTHGYLEQSKMFAYYIASRNIVNSERFASVLRKYKTDIWICGHTHLPHYLRGRITRWSSLNNTIFINVSAIRKDPFMDIESNILIFKQKSNYVLIRSRQHEDGIYIPNLDIFHKLSHRFKWDGNKPVMKAMR